MAIILKYQNVINQYMSLLLSKNCGLFNLLRFSLVTIFCFICNGIFLVHCIIVADLLHGISLTTSEKLSVNIVTMSEENLRKKGVPQY